MPRVNRRPKRRSAGYGELDIKFLLRGPHGVPCAMTEAEDASDDQSIRAAWESMRAALLPKFVSDHPGQRPWAWWQFEAPERRRRIDGKVHPFDDKARTLAVAKTDRRNFWEKAYALRFGMPAAMIPPFDQDVYLDFLANLLCGRESTIFESEWEYLVRLDLLLPEDSP